MRWPTVFPIIIFTRCTSRNEQNKQSKHSFLYAVNVLIFNHCQAKTGAERMTHRRLNSSKFIAEPSAALINFWADGECFISNRID